MVYSLGVTLSQIGEAGFTRFDLQMQCLRLQTVLEAKLAAHHLIEFVLVFQEARLRLGRETFPEKTAPKDALARMLLPLLLNTSQLLDQLSPLRPCLDSTLLEGAKLNLLQMFVEDQHLGDHCTRQHLPQ